jgi:hypothetical protein
MIEMDPQQQYNKCVQHDELLEKVWPDGNHTVRVYYCQDYYIAFVVKEPQGEPLSHKEFENWPSFADLLDLFVSCSNRTVPNELWLIQPESEEQ